MDETQIFEVCREGIFTLIIIASPTMLTALLVGLVIALLQAITQIQETTLTFVPKILAVFLVLSLSMSFMLHTLTDYNNRLFEKIAQLE